MEFVLVWLLFTIACGLVASSRNASVLGWSFIGLFLGPFGLLFALFIKKDTQTVSITKSETNSNDNTDKLIELSKMLEKGLITEEEFMEHKSKL